MENTDADHLTGAERVRLKTLVTNIASEAILRAIRKSGGALHRDSHTVEGSINYLIEQNYRKLVAAAKIPPAIHNAVSKKKKADARKELADELRNARKRLRQLQFDIKCSERLAAEALQASMKEKRAQFRERLMSARTRLKSLEELIKNKSKEYADKWIESVKPCIDEQLLARQYPDAPQPSVYPTKEGLHIPEIPGIYFLWEGQTIVYVGQSIKLSNRLRLGQHHVLSENQLISFIPFEARELTWAECYYIGALRPQRNFGASARHYVKEGSVVKEGDCHA